MENVTSRYYNSYETSKGNLVWSAGANLAWNELTLVHGSIYMREHTDDPGAIRTIMNLNRNVLKKK